MNNLDSNVLDQGQNIRQLEREIDYLNRQYRICNSERLNYQQSSPGQAVSPYHIKLLEQMKDLNSQLKKGIEYQQYITTQAQRGFEAERLVGTQNDITIQRLRQHIYQHQLKIVEYKALMDSQKMSVLCRKNIPHMKKQICSQNYVQLKRAHDILCKEVIEKTQSNRELQLEFGQLKKQYDLAQLEAVVIESRFPRM